MTLQDIIRLFLRNWKILVVIPLVLAISIFFFTRGGKRVYVSDTTIYTGIASGYSITGDVKADYFSANTAFDNLITLINSRETKEEVILRLLATHLMLTDVDPALLTWNSYLNIQEVIDPTLRNRLLGPTFDSTYSNIRNYYVIDTENEIYELLNSEEEFYSYHALFALESTRIGSSDIIRVEYETTDPAICKHTLELLTDVFINRNRDLREGQTETVVSYYEIESKKAYERLEELEQKFLAFNEANDIINYDEQTKNISSHRELLYTDYAEVEMDYVAAQSALQTIENKLETRATSVLSSNELIELRNRIASLNSQITNIKIFNQPEPGSDSERQLEQLRLEVDRETRGMQESVTDYYAQTHSIGGIPSQGLLDEWVRNLIMVEEGAAKLLVMDRRKEEFLREYQRMAPVGATLKRIEREIDLAEREYLTFLNSLNLSRLNQQNIALTAQLRIVDQPYLPTKPRSSKRILLVLLGAIGGFFSIASVLLGKEFLDPALQKPSIASKQINLPVAGIIPLFDIGFDSKAYRQNAITQLARNIILKACHKKASAPLVVGLISHFPGEGKTTAIKILMDKLKMIGTPAVAFLPQNSNHKDEFNDISWEAYVPEAYRESNNQEIETIFISRNEKIVLVELPSLDTDLFPFGLLPHLDLMLITVKANRAWTKADHKAFEAVFDLGNGPAEILLTGVLNRNMEEFSDSKGKNLSS